MKSEIIERKLDFTIDQPVDKVFPLQSPEGEKLWVPGWDYENLMGHTNLHEDYIFTTQTHDHAAADALWIVKTFDPDNYHVQYYKIEPGEKIGIVTVHCETVNGDRTKVTITYKYLGLSEKGNEFIRNFSEDEYELFILEWKRLLEEYFEKNQ
ncbi:hypothetical protein ACFLTH_00955 [Bacteroidota bacterium]